MHKHRSRIATREDFTSYWSLPFFLKGRKNKFVVVKCEVCNPRSEKYNRLSVKRETNQLIKAEY